MSNLNTNSKPPRKRVRSIRLGNQLDQRLQLHADHLEITVSEALRLLLYRVLDEEGRLVKRPQ